MASYSVTHETPGGTNLALINLTGGANNQLFLEMFSITADETAPAEQQQLYNLVRTTDVGTGGTGLTEIKTNPLTSAPVGAAIGGTFTGQPTISNVIWLGGVHQKIPFVMQYYPGREPVSPAVAGDGLELECNAASAAFAAPVSMNWHE